MLCHNPPFFGEEAAANGDIGGVEVAGNDDGPRAKGLKAAISAGLATRDLGDGMAEPVEA